MRNQTLLQTTRTLWPLRMSHCSPHAQRSNAAPLDANTLLITRADSANGNATANSITLQNYQAGQLGLVLPGAPAPTAAPTVATSFDLITQAGLKAYQQADTAHSTQNLLLQNTATAYNLGTAADPMWRSSSVRTGSGDDVIEGGAIPAVSNTITATGAGNDLVIGGDARDVLFGGAGDDTLVGGSGGDIIIADGNAGGLMGEANASANEALIVDGAPTTVGSNALLRIDHSGVVLGTTGSDSTGRRINALHADVAIKAEGKDCYRWSHRVTPKTIAARACCMRAKDLFDQKAQAANTTNWRITA